MKNYKPDADIRKELGHVKLDIFLDFDNDGNYEFLKCVYCDGPLLGHMEVKCPRLDYDSVLVKRYEGYLKGLKEFRVALEERRSEIKKQEMQSMASMVRMTVDTAIQERGNAQGTTQLVKIERFEDMVLEVKKIKLAERLEYAMGLQFLERMETSGKINGMERKILRDLLEDEDGNPRDGDRLEVMKKELKRMKVVENREEPFKTHYQEDTTYWEGNDGETEAEEMIGFREVI